MNQQMTKRKPVRGKPDRIARMLLSTLSIRRNMSRELLQRKLESIVGVQNVLRDEPIDAHTTFRVGGPADLFVIPSSVEEVKEVLSACDAEGETTYIVGRGSNLLVADVGLRGVVVQLAGNFAHADVKCDGTIVATAGISNAKVASQALKASLTGFEFAAGIPGTIGGAAIMNAGAYDGEFKQVATSVTCLDVDRNIIEVSADQAKWGYRHSMMMDSGMTVLEVTLKLAEGDPESIRARMDELAHRRSDKQPLDLPSAGSTFKRPEGHYAGKLIQDAGLMGYTVGGAQVSTKHAGFVVNFDNATASDIAQVIYDVKARVLSEFGVELEPEVRMWGFDA